MAGAVLKVVQMAAKALKTAKKAPKKLPKSAPKKAQPKPSSPACKSCPAQKGKATGPQGVKPYETGTYKELKAKSKPHDGMQIDHQPSNASNLARARKKKGSALTPAEIKRVRDNGKAVAVPDKWHQKQSPTYGGRNTKAKIKADAANPKAAAKRDSQAMIDGAKPKDKAAAERAAKKIRSQ